MQHAIQGSGFTCLLLSYKNSLVLTLVDSQLVSISSDLFIFKISRMRSQLYKQNVTKEIVSYEREETVYLLLAKFFLLNDNSPGYISIPAGRLGQIVSN